MKIYVTGKSNPEAYITKDKQRLKQFNGLVYLNNGDNFEVEIFNPTQNHILAQISMNGKSISRAGLVLRPGERVFLERYLDTNNKFVYSTYDVNGGNEQVKNAIAFNGVVKIEFFNEIPVIRQYTNSTILTSFPTYTTWATPIVYYSSAGGVFDGTLTATYGTAASGSITTTGLDNKTTSTYSANPNPVLGNKTSIVNDSFMDLQEMLTERPKSFPPDPPKSFERKTETGTIEKGDTSRQSFESVDRNFQYSSFHNVEWHIIPKSQQPITSKDLQQYCTNCGSKIAKQTFKFCPNCGEKIE